jgi:hypothetical protein
MFSRRNTAISLRLPVLGATLLFGATSAAGALTVDQQVTPAYLREHAREFTVKVARRNNGLIGFTVTRTLAQPKYRIARLLVKRDGETLAESSTPAFARNNTSSFYFAVSARDVAGSEFELGESHFVGPEDQPVALPGTVNYRFRLSDFVPEALLKATPTR